jgi:hypothetical protein
MINRETLKFIKENGDDKLVCIYSNDASNAFETVTVQLIVESLLEAYNEIDRLRGWGDRFTNIELKKLDGTMNTRTTEIVETKNGQST